MKVERHLGEKGDRQGGTGLSSASLEELCPAESEVIKCEQTVS